MKLIVATVLSLLAAINLQPGKSMIPSFRGLLWSITRLNLSLANGWLFTPAKRIMVAEHRRCDPADQTWRPYPKDPTRFLFCDSVKRWTTSFQLLSLFSYKNFFCRKYSARQCPQVQGSQQIFDGTKKQCMKPIDMIDFKFNTPNGLYFIQLHWNTFRALH